MDSNVMVTTVSGSQTKESVRFARTLMFVIVYLFGKSGKSHEDRFCWLNVNMLPTLSSLASKRDAFNCIGESTAYESDLFVIDWWLTTVSASRIDSSQSSFRIRSVPLEALYPSLNNRWISSKAASNVLTNCCFEGTSKRTLSSLIVFLARTKRLFMLSLFVKNDLANAVILNPHSVLSIKAVWESLEIDGWQHINIIRNWSSEMVSSEKKESDSNSAVSGVLDYAKLSAMHLSRYFVRFIAFKALFFATVCSHATGFSGTPLYVQLLMASTMVSWTISSTIIKLLEPKIPARTDTIFTDSYLKKVLNKCVYFRRIFQWSDYDIQSIKGAPSFQLWIFCQLVFEKLSRTEETCFYSVWCMPFFYSRFWDKYTSIPPSIIWAKNKDSPPLKRRTLVVEGPFRFTNSVERGLSYCIVEGSKSPTILISFDGLVKAVPISPIKGTVLFSQFSLADPNIADIDACVFPKVWTTQNSGIDKLESSIGKMKTKLAASGKVFKSEKADLRVPSSYFRTGWISVEKIIAASKLLMIVSLLIVFTH